MGRVGIEPTTLCTALPLSYRPFSPSLRSRENSKIYHKSYLHIFYRGIQLHVRLKGTRIALLAAYYYNEGATLRLQFIGSETLDATFPIYRGIHLFFVITHSAVHLHCV